MKNRLVLILLAVALLGGGYLFYRSQDAQVIGRQVDQLLENVEHKKISLRKESDVRASLSEVLAKEVTLFGASPVPSGDFSEEEVTDKVLQFHAWTSLCEINESDRNIEIKGEEAQVTIVADVHVAVGKNIQRKERWTMMFKLAKSDTWRINGIKGIPSANATSAQDAREAADLLE